INCVHAAQLQQPFGNRFFSRAVAVARLPAVYGVKDNASVRLNAHCASGGGDVILKVKLTVSDKRTAQAARSVLSCQPAGVSGSFVRGDCDPLPNAEAVQAAEHLLGNPLVNAYNQLSLGNGD